MAKDRSKLAAEVLYERACEDVKKWFCRYDKGMVGLVTIEAVRDLADRVRLRDELQEEVYPPAPTENTDGQA